jgi:hypothetical protein
LQKFQWRDIHIPLFEWLALNFIHT